ncbi:MAG: helix-turn-helix domain-containing protein [Mesorhizobium sp.]|nr:helix-turn-helix domain-containing protein [Mesorhizobium sp.]
MSVNRDASSTAGSTIDAALLTPSQVAELLAVSAKTLTGWRGQGRGPAFIRMGRTIRYRRGDIEGFIDRSGVGSHTDERRHSAAAKAAKLSLRKVKRALAGDERAKSRKRAEKVNIGSKKAETHAERLEQRRRRKKRLKRLGQLRGERD